LNIIKNLIIYFIEHKKVAWISLFIIWWFLTSIIVWKDNVWYIPLFINSANLINIIILIFFCLSIILFSLFIIFATLDWLVKIFQYIIHTKIVLYKWCKLKDNSPIINIKYLKFIQEKILITIIVLATILWCLIAWASTWNRPVVDIKVNSKEVPYEWRLIYNTGNWYLIEKGWVTRLIPYENIEYIELRKISKK
jgi:hypothetical protein